MWSVAHRVLILAAAAALVSCGGRRAAVDAPRSPRHETIERIKAVERELGFGGTSNFEHAPDGRGAYYRCYYTGKLRLPESYEGLRMKDGDEFGCDLNEERWDVFFYKIEAVAGDNTPVTEALEEASLERLAVVVSHEDFHEDPQVQRLPTRIGEAATTLIGFLTAAHFAAREYGPDSETARNLAREAELYRRKSEIVNRYHQEVSDLYEDLREKRIGRDEALERKAGLFARMQKECEAIEPEPTSFNKCLAANNNAGLAFEMTYTGYYPLLEELHRSGGSDIKQTIQTLRGLGDLGAKSESVTESQVRTAIRNGERNAPSAGW